MAALACCLAALLHQAVALPKILCLHGGGQTASGFESMAGMVALKNSLSSTYEFVFAQSPEPTSVWIRDVPGGKSSTTTDPAWAATSVNFLNGIVQSQGPFYGILGYSQGSAFSTVYLSQAPANTFQVAVLFCGYLPSLHTGLMQTIEAQSPFGGIPAMVFMGANDGVISNPMTQTQAAKFTSPTIVRSTTAGHEPPQSTDSTYQQVLTFLSSSPTYAPSSGVTNAPVSGGTSAPATGVTKAPASDDKTGGAGTKHGWTCGSDGFWIDASGVKSTYGDCASGDGKSGTGKDDTGKVDTGKVDTGKDDTVTAAPGAATLATPIVIVGSFNMNVPDPDAFISDTALLKATSEGIAASIGADASYVKIVVTKVAGRRLDLEKTRQLAAGSVKVDYTVSIPASASSTAAAISEKAASVTVAELATAVQTKVTAAKPGATVTVTSKTVPTSTGGATADATQAPTAPASASGTSAPTMQAVLVLFAACATSLN